MIGIVKGYALCVRSRILIPLTYAPVSITGLLVACRGIPPLRLALPLTISTALVSLSIYLYNDICDVEEDRRGAELGVSLNVMRPLQRGLITRGQMMVFVAFSASLGLAAALLVGANVFLIEGLFLLLGLAYSTEPIRLKRRFLFKQGTVASGYVISALVSGVAVGAISLRLMYLASLYVVLSFSISTIYDLKDIEGDLVAGIKSIPVVWGPDATFRLSLALLTSTALASAVGYSLMGFNLALPILGSIVFASMIYVIYPLTRLWKDKNMLMKVISRRIVPLQFILQAIVVVASLPITL